MRIRSLALPLSSLILALGIAGCGGGIKEGMPTDLTESPENIKQSQEVDEANLKYPIDGSPTAKKK